MLHSSWGVGPLQSSKHEGWQRSSAFGLAVSAPLGRGGTCSHTHVTGVFLRICRGSIRQRFAFTVSDGTAYQEVREKMVEPSNKNCQCGVGKEGGRQGRKGQRWLEWMINFWQKGFQLRGGEGKNKGKCEGNLKTKHVAAKGSTAKDKRKKIGCVH